MVERLLNVLQYDQFFSWFRHGVLERYCCPLSVIRSRTAAIVRPRSTCSRRAVTSPALTISPSSSAENPWPNMIASVCPSGASSSKHRHNAHTFVYVLEGSIVMAVEGGKETTLGPGQTFYESPDDVHTVSKNASDSKPAKFLVFFVKDKGAPASTPVK